MKHAAFIAIIGASLLATPAADAVTGPVRVFLLAGQSNMEGHAQIRTIDFLGEDEDGERAALLRVFKPDGQTLVTRDDVWVVSNGAFFAALQPGLGARKVAETPGSKIGPEYAFGYFMGQALQEQVLLIKVAEGGTSLYQNWRPPSAGLPPDARPEEFGGMYRALLANTRDTLRNLKTLIPGYDERAGYEISGFVWFQGFNDMFDPLMRREYSRNLVCLIKDLRRDLDAPDMKVVVGVMGINGPRNEIGKQKEIRDSQRFVNTVPEFAGTVRAIETAPLLHPKVLELNCPGSPPDNIPQPGRWLYPERDTDKEPITPEEQALLGRATSDLGYHYFGEGRFFILLGKSMAEAMLGLMKAGR